MVGSPWQVLTLLISYNYFVLKLGPRLMENRKAFNVDRLIQVYNAVQILLCAWLVERVSSWSCLMLANSSRCQRDKKMLIIVHNQQPLPYNRHLIFKNANAIADQLVGF